MKDQHCASFVKHEQKKFQLKLSVKAFSQADTFSFTRAQETSE